MKVFSTKVSVSDKRGRIIDILQNEPVSYVAVVTFRKGAVRGNHYHNRTEQYNYIMKGRLKVITREPKGRPKIRTIETGHLFLIPRRVRHVMIALEPSTLLVLTRGVRGGKNYERDTIRLRGTDSLLSGGSR